MDIVEEAKKLRDSMEFAHITLKNKRFHNGQIMEVRNDFLIINDEKFGEMPIFFSEVNSIYPRIPKNS